MVVACGGPQNSVHALKVGHRRGNVRGLKACCYGGKRHLGPNEDVVTVDITNQGADGVYTSRTKFTRAQLTCRSLIKILYDSSN